MNSKEKGFPQQQSIAALNPMLTSFTEFPLHDTHTYTHTFTGRICNRSWITAAFLYNIMDVWFLWPCVILYSVCDVLICWSTRECKWRDMVLYPYVCAVRACSYSQLHLKASQASACQRLGMFSLMINKHINVTLRETEVTDRETHCFPPAISSSSGIYCLCFCLLTVIMLLSQESMFSVFFMGLNEWKSRMDE